MGSEGSPALPIVFIVWTKVVEPCPVAVARVLIDIHVARLCSRSWSEGIVGDEINWFRKPRSHGEWIEWRKNSCPWCSGFEIMADRIKNIQFRYVGMYSSISLSVPVLTIFRSSLPSPILCTECDL
jgi:hypothetical protein